MKFSTCILLTTTLVILTVNVIFFTKLMTKNYFEFIKVRGSPINN